MSKHVENLVWRYAKVPPSEKLVLLKLADAANPDGTNAYPSLQEMAEECYLSKRTIQRALDKLQTLGVIEVQQVYHPGRHVPTTWRIRVDILTTGRMAPGGDDTDQHRGDTAERRGDILAGASRQRMDSEVTKCPLAQADTYQVVPKSIETTEVVPVVSGVVEAVVVVKGGSPIGQHRKKLRPKINPGTGQVMLAAYHDLFTAKYGQKPVVTDKDGQMLKRIAASQGLDQALALLKTFFQSRDRFIEHAGHTVGVFASQVNKLIADHAEPPPMVETRDADGRVVRQGPHGYLDIR